jgi:quinol monooxygenase YgiN
MERVTLWGWLDFEGKDVTAILRGATHLIEPTYQEAGCVHYVWTADPVREGRMWVFEEWETVQSLTDHLVGQLYRDMAAYLVDSGMTGAEVDKYRVDRKEPVYDGSGMPRADFS